MYFSALVVGNHDVLNALGIAKYEYLSTNIGVGGQLIIMARPLRVVMARAFGSGSRSVRKF